MAAHTKEYRNLEKRDTETLSQAEFESNYMKLNRPVVITGVTKGWAGNDSLTFAKFAELFADRVCGVIPVSNGYYSINTERGSRLQHVYVKDAMQATKDNTQAKKWAIASAIECFEPEIDDYYQVPAYCKRGEFLRKRLFVSPAGAITPIHQDLFENLYIVMRGNKRVLLFPPKTHTYRNSFFSKLPNHGNVDPLNPDFEKYPKFELHEGYDVTIKAGECLYIPALWWHYLRTEEDTLAVSFWWSTGWLKIVARTAYYYKKLLNI